jgi:hypothetical protein
VEGGGDVEREQIRERLGVVGAAGEEPVLATDGDLTKRAFGAVVLELEASVVEEATERAVLVLRVAEGLREQRARRGLGLVRIAPREEGFDVGT